MQRPLTPCLHKKHNCRGQALVEFVLFTLILLIASYGMLKLFVVAWTNKFDFVSIIAGAAGALF